MSLRNAAHDGLTFYLRLLSVKYWHHVALNSVAGWLLSASDTNPLQEVLVRASSIDQLIRCVAEADRSFLYHMHFKFSFFARFFCFKRKESPWFHELLSYDHAGKPVDRASASNVLPPLIRILQLKKLNRVLGESGMPSQVLKLLHHPEAVVRKDVLQVCDPNLSRQAESFRLWL